MKEEKSKIDFGHAKCEVFILCPNGGAEEAVGEWRQERR